jgi:hypothetical protein
VGLAADCPDTARCKVDVRVVALHRRSNALTCGDKGIRLCSYRQTRFSSLGRMSAFRRVDRSALTSSSHETVRFSVTSSVYQPITRELTEKPDFPGSFVGVNGERGNVHRVRSSSPSDERYRYVPDQRLGQVRFRVSSIFVKFDKIRSFFVFWGIGSACVSFKVSGARCLEQKRTRGHEVSTGSFPPG